MVYRNRPEQPRGRVECMRRHKGRALNRLTPKNRIRARLRLDHTFRVRVRVRVKLSCSRQCSEPRACSLPPTVGHVGTATARGQWRRGWSTTTTARARGILAMLCLGLQEASESYSEGGYSMTLYGYHCH